MKVLFIGGTGLISSACSQLAVDRGIELTILNRGQSAKYGIPRGASILTGDIHGDHQAVANLLKGRRFDAIVDWVAFTPTDVEKDIELFSNNTRQYVFISSASVYQKPPIH